MDEKELKALAASVGLNKPAREVGFTSPYLVSSILPYRKPTGEERWRREVVRGTRSVVMVSQKEGIPYGRYARLVFAYITSQAVHQAADPSLDADKERRIDFGTSFNDFMRKIGVAKGGGTSAKIREQVFRIAALNLSAWRTVDNGGEVHTEKVPGGGDLSERVEFWHSSSLPDQECLLGDSYLTLTPAVFKLITDRPVPFDFKTLTSLRSPLAMDLYLWATYTSHSMRTLGGFWSFSEIAELTGLSSTGSSEKIRRAVDQVRKAWGEDCPLIVLGESGTNDAGVFLAGGSPHIARRANDDEEG